MKKLSKWNWNNFTFIFLVTALGISTNSSIKSFNDGLILMAIITIPLGLIFAWIGKENNIS